MLNSQNSLIDSETATPEGGQVQYYALGWKEFGTATNGEATKELLPKEYSFRMNYGGASLDKSQNIGTDATVNLYPDTLWPSDAKEGFRSKLKIRRGYWEKWIKKWNQQYTLPYAQIPIIHALAYASQDAQKWLQYDYRFGILSKGVAQTRLAASYGLLQVLYTSAIHYRSYDKNQLPEKLNEIEIGFPLTLKFLKGKIAKTQKLNEKEPEKLDKIFTFSEGLEDAYRKAYYPGYNEEETYPQKVVNKYKKYNPISN